MTEWGKDEVELVRRCREGSDAAYAVLVRLHRPRLFTLAYRLTGDRSTAEDVVQDVFIAAFKSIERFEPKPSLAAWLNTITVRMAGRAAEKQTRRPKSSLDEMAESRDGSDRAFAGFVDLDPSSDPHLAAETAELREALRLAVERLPFKYRAAVVLRFIIGLDYADAALALGVPLNTFKSHLLRGTRILREDLATELVSAPSAVGPVVNGDESTDEVAYLGAPERATRS